MEILLVVQISGPLHGPRSPGSLHWAQSPSRASCRVDQLLAIRPVTEYGLRFCVAHNGELRRLAFRFQTYPDA